VLLAARWPVIAVGVSSCHPERARRNVEVSGSGLRAGRPAAPDRRRRLSGLTLLADDEQGFWERNGYHDRGDLWLEQRYQGD
jgi:DMSO/TMAO reductase YedYZ molybdopterin-dependent catalytic subunit